MSDQTVPNATPPEAAAESRSAPSSPFVGKRLGEYAVVRELGRGGMGVVYEAVQTSLNRRVALKVLGPGLGLTPRAVDRFRREAAAAAKLHHTNVVPVYATGEQDGTHFYAMELIDGPALDAVIRQMREQKTAASAPTVPPELVTTNTYTPPDPLSSSGVGSSGGSSADRFDRIAAMVADVADALHHAHQQGVTHRDIKPSNLLLAADGRLSVTDFGLARMLEEPGMTVTGEFVGTPAYMSPEQITAGRIPVDHRTDLYSLGATLYELLTLRPPFRADGRDKLLAMVIQKDPPAPRSVDPKIPRDLETICLKCLEKDPDRRYQSAKALADDLRRYVSRFAILARRAGPLGQLKKWVRRNPALAASGVAVLLAVGVAAVFAWRADAAERRRLADERRRDDELRVERREVALEKAVAAALNGQFDESERQIATAEELDTPIGQVRMVRGIVARYRDDPTAITHFEIAAEHLGQSVAVKALLANSYWDTWDVRAEPLFAELLALQPHTAEDFLFKGQIVAQYDDPRVGLRDIQRAREMRPSPLTWLASADARVTVALDSRSITDSEQALREAETARDLLPASDHALAANLSSRLALWDLYADRAGPGDDERAEEHRAAAGRLVAAAGGRWNAPLRTACLYYHARTGNDRAALAYIRDVLDRSQEPSVGFDLAAVLYGVGDLPGARAAAVAVRQTRDIRGWQDLIPWVFILAEEGKQDEAWAVAEALPKTPGFGFMTVGHLGWFLGEQENARRIYAAEIAAGRVPRFQNGWYLVLARFGAGDGTADDEQALIRHAGESRLRLCEAHFLIGMRHLARGNKEQARLHFENTLRTRVFYYFEHFWSRNFLSRMKADPGWPRWIKTK